MALKSPAAVHVKDAKDEDEGSFVKRSALVFERVEWR